MLILFLLRRYCIPTGYTPVDLLDRRVGERKLFVVVGTEPFSNVAGVNEPTRDRRTFRTSNLSTALLDPSSEVHLTPLA